VRVLLVWPVAARLTGISVRYERYARGLRALGHDPVTVCLPATAEGYGEPVAVAPGEAALRDAAFYRGLRADAAVVVTWLVFPDVVAALKAAGLRVVSIGDSDGRIGVRAHPGPTFARMVRQHSGWGMRLRAARYWLTLYAAGPAAQDRPVLDSAGHADRVVVCSPAAAAHLRRFFDSYRRPDLAAKVAAVPYPIDGCFLTEPAPAERDIRAVAVGRWDDAQKDAGLLCRAASRFLAAGGRAEFNLFGPGGVRWFGPLTCRWPQVTYHGSRPAEAIAEALRRSRVLLLPSRWESGPVVLNEALASGCTVVATDSVPAAVSACAEGGFGTVSRGRSAGRLAAALRTEVDAWERGDRDPARIAAHWRPRFEPGAVCRELLAGCGERR
jgi:glycosyltransferase involved in cell wall biosynthesis